MRSYIFPTFLLIAAISVIISVMSGSKSGKEQVEEMHSILDEAFNAFESQDYQRFGTLYSEAGRIYLDLSLDPEGVEGIPEASLNTVRQGLCDHSTFTDYYRAVGVLYEKTDLLQGRRGSYHDQDMLSSELELLHWQFATNASLYSANEHARHKDCNKKFPGFLNRVQTVETYIGSSLPEWLARYEAIYGSPVMEDRKGFSRVNKMLDLDNWNSLSEEERKYFTLGRPEVESCISSFTGLKAPSPAEADAYDVSQLCRDGLN